MALNSALTQTLILGTVFFFLPGGYNAINSMAGGIGNQDVIAKGNTILNILFAVSSLFAPVFVNVFGARVTLLIGALGYPLYVVALLFAGLKDLIPDGWILVASAILGLCAALTWTAQGTLIMAYPTPEKKGSYFSYFWILFNAGGVCNSFFIFASNLNSTTPQADPTTFWVFIVVMLVGCCCILLLQPLDKVIRPDGSRIELAPEPAVIPEIVGMLKLVMDPKPLALVPLFLYTNWCYNYQFQVFNDPLFTTPTKGLNNVFYWGAQMLSAWLLGLYHDSDRPPRTRAYVSLAVIGAICLSTWACGAVANYVYDLSGCPRDELTGSVVCPHQIEFKDFSAWILPLLLYTMWGACDALVQCWSYWILGQLSDRPEILSRYSGWYKTWNSLGNAIGAFLITELTQKGANAQLWINIALFAAALPPAAYVCSTIPGGKRVSSAAQPFSDA
jgi:MFS family permease